MIDRKVRAHQRDARRRGFEDKTAQGCPNRIRRQPFEIDGRERDSAGCGGERRLIGERDRRRTSERAVERVTAAASAAEIAKDRGIRISQASPSLRAGQLQCPG